MDSNACQEWNASIPNWLPMRDYTQSPHNLSWLFQNDAFGHLVIHSCKPFVYSSMWITEFHYLSLALSQRNEEMINFLLNLGSKQNVICCLFSSKIKNISLTQPTT